jgi:hypothetical protein
MIAYDKDWRSRLPFFERHFGGHVSFMIFGHRLTIYGWNAMHLAVNFHWSRQKIICFHPTIKMFGCWWPWYLYVSHDGTPCSATWGIGPGFGH